MGHSSIWFVIAGLLVVGGIYAFIARPFMSAPDQGVVCTAEAMQCPDGSWVGRTGPHCEFVCPTASTSAPTTVTAHIGQTVSGAFGVSIEPLVVVEDSRCPIDVQCIQAGRVRLQAQVTGAATTTTIFTLGTPITVGDVVITLTSAAPAKQSHVQLEPSDYTFTFKITKK